MKEIQKDRRNIGVNFINGKQTTVRIWSPLAKKVELSIIEGKTLKLDKGEYGYWGLTTDKMSEGECYIFKIDGKEYPDITSLSQPDGVHKSSEAVDLTAF